VVGTLSAGYNDSFDGNCTLRGDGRFAHVNLQSATARQFLSNFPDIQYVSGHLIFIEAASKSSLATLRRALRKSSLPALQRGVRVALSSVAKARDYADGQRSTLLKTAHSELRAASRSRDINRIQEQIRATIETLNQIVSLGIG
jgi:hypothetical protein